MFVDIIRVARSLRVEFAFPTQTLYLRKEDAPTHEQVLANLDEACGKGREEAALVVRETLGEPVRCPPPVTF